MVILVPFPRKLEMPMKNILLFVLLATLAVYAKDNVQVQVSAIHAVTHEARDLRAITDRGLMGARTPGRQVESFNLDTVIDGEHVLLACEDEKGCEAPALGTYSGEVKRRGHVHLTFDLPLTHKKVTRWYKIGGAW
jgi:hypothetical protein